MKAQLMKDISNLYQNTKANHAQSVRLPSFRPGFNQEKTRTRIGNMSACARITMALARR